MGKGLQGSGGKRVVDSSDSAEGIGPSTEHTVNGTQKGRLGTSGGEEEEGEERDRGINGHQAEDWSLFYQILLCV
jgi:hypothetical protein